MKAVSSNIGRLSTLLGSLALVLWTLEPLVVSGLEEFQIFQSLTLVFSICFVFTIIRVTLKKRWQLILKQPLFIWIYGVLAICGSDFAYMLGAYSAPIAHVDLIDYLWPCMMVIIIGFLPNQQFKFKYVFSAFLGLLAVVLLITNCEGLDGFNPIYLKGYLLALFGVLIWGSYTIYSTQNKQTPPDMMGLYCGVGAIITGVLHFNLEQTVMPTFSQFYMALILGLAGPGLAYQLWDYGIKFGNARLLGVMCYLARVGSVALLVLFGKQELNQAIIVACSLAMLAVFFSLINIRLSGIVKIFSLPKELFSKIITSIFVAKPST